MFMRHVIYVDAGFSKGNGKLAWFNETTNSSDYKKTNCKDSYRCEYAAIVFALEKCKGVNAGDELELRMDNEVVSMQLNRVSAINDEDVMKQALRIWNWGKNKRVGITFAKVPRKENKAGKMLGS